MSLLRTVVPLYCTTDGMKSGDLVGQTFLATYSFVEKIAQNHTADTTCVCVQQKHLFISFRVE